MNVDGIRKYCLTFAQATENLQWGDDLCFKIRGKIFATLALTSVPPKLCFKCTPETFAELLERDGIRPAPYVGRYQWVILDRLEALRTDELQDFIRQSYEMVAAKAPEKARSGSNASKKKSAMRKSAESRRHKAKR
jgi:predicted DNA-binding protein (MmcQ/YjbR family)